MYYILVNKDKTEYALIGAEQFGNSLYDRDTYGNEMKIVKKIKTKSWEQAKKQYNKFCKTVD